MLFLTQCLLIVWGINSVKHTHISLGEAIKTDTLILKKIDVKDTMLFHLLDTLIKNDKKCPYFSDSSCISIVFRGVRDSNLHIIPNYYLIETSVEDINLLLGLKQEFYFIYDGFRCSVDFTDGFQATLFFDLTLTPSEQFVFSSDLVVHMNDDSHSIFTYWYINGKYYFGDSYSCKP